MAPANTSRADIKAALEKDYPGWHVLYSDVGRWWAQLWPVPRKMFNTQTMLDADTPEKLRTNLAKATAQATSRSLAGASQ